MVMAVVMVRSWRLQQFAASTSASAGTGAGAGGKAGGSDRQLL